MNLQLNQNFTKFWILKTKGYVSRDTSCIIGPGRIIRNVASLNILVHDTIDLLYYEHWTDKWKYLYVYKKRSG